MNLQIDENGAVIFSTRVTEHPAHRGIDHPLEIGTDENPTSLVVKSNYRILEGYGALLEEDGDNCPQLRTHTVRGSLSNPESLQKGDYVTHFMALGYNGKEYETVAGFRVDVVDDVTENSMPGVFTIGVGNYFANKSGIQHFNFDYTGNFTSPKVTVQQNFSPPCFNTIEELKSIDAEEGNIVYVKQEKTFYGYNGEWSSLNSK